MLFCSLREGLINQIFLRQSKRWDSFGNQIFSSSAISLIRSRTPRR